MNLVRYNDRDYAFRLYNEMSYNLYPIAGTANHLAMQSLFECYDYFEENNLLRYEVKRYMRQATNTYDKYLARVRRILADKFMLFSDMSRIAAAKLQPQVDALHAAVKAFAHKHQLPDADLKTALCTTHALIGISCAVIDSLRSHYQSQTVYNISVDINAVKMTGVRHAFDQVASLFLRVRNDVDIDSDEQVMQATDALMLRLHEHDLLNEACREAMRLNPDMLKYVTDEEKKLFQDDTKKEEDNR